MSKRTVVIAGVLIGVFGLVNYDSLAFNQQEMKGQFLRFGGQMVNALTSGTGESAHRVTEVVDGDTIKVRKGGEEQTVRLLGIDTPELAHGDKKRECFARNATSFVRNRIQDQRVVLVRDYSQKNTDAYDRLLRYVSLPDNERSLNYMLIAQGYGFEYTFNVPYKRQDLFQSAEQNAREGQNGLWDPQTCDGDV